jgi:hypothetical protein
MPALAAGIFTALNFTAGLFTGTPFTKVYLLD